MCRAHQKAAEMSCQEKMSNTVQGAFHSVFSRWGRFVARKPCMVIAVSFVFALICMARLWISFGGNKLPEETEGLKLWTPTDSQAGDDKDKYEEVWASNYRYNQIYFTASSKGANVLTSSVLKEVARFDELVWRNISATMGKKDNGRGAYEPLEFTAPNPTTYHSLCEAAAGYSGAGAPGCLQTSHPLDLFADGHGGYVLDLSDAEILAIVNRGKGVSPELYPPLSSKRFPVEAAYGGIERDASGTIVSAQAIKLAYLFIDSERDEPVDVAAHAYESQINLFVGPDWAADPPHSEGSVWTDGGGYGFMFSSSSLAVYPWTNDAISVEGGKLIRSDVPMLSAGIMLIAVYACIVLARFDRVAGRALLALAGLASCGLAIGMAYGLATAFGFDLNPVINVLPFILIGIGVDDMFVLVNALEHAPTSLSVEERLGIAIGQAGVSITITSFTDFLAFLLGTTSNLPALQTFCVFAAIGILGDFLMQITFFAGWLALDAAREKKNKVDCCPCCCAPVHDGLQRRGCCCIRLPCATPQGGPLRAMIKKIYLPFLRKDAVKAAIIAVFVCYCGFSAWAASNLKQDFDYRWFVNDDAKLQEAFKVQDDYFAEGGLSFNVVTPATASFDYTTIAGQQKLIDLKLHVEANEWVSPGSTSSWYAEFRDWAASCSLSAANHTVCHGVYVVDTSGAVASGAAAVAAGYVPPPHFYTWLDQWLTETSAGKGTASNIVWNAGADGQRRSSVQLAAGLKGARFRSMYIATDEASDQVDMMQTMRDSVGLAEIEGAYPYALQYLFFEQYDIIVNEAVTNLVLALVAVFTICFVIIADLRAALLVTLCVVMVDVSILGLMYLWDLTIDSVTIINLVLAIGLSVDYSAHVAHAFCVASGTHQERMEKAIEEMGCAVIHGGVSTFIAVLVLAFAKSYVFRVFFKMFFSICVFGLTHGLIFLPCALYFVGPPALNTFSPDAPAKPAAKQVTSEMSA